MTRVVCLTQSLSQMGARAIFAVSLQNKGACLEVLFQREFFFFLLLSSLELSDTKVYEP